MRIYLDNCCFNRPFDDQSQLRIRLETEAKLAIQGLIRSRNLDLVWSYILDYENAANPYAERQHVIGQWRQLASVDIAAMPTVVDRARQFASFGIKAKDALHLACAIEGQCSHFLTTDEPLIRHARKIPDIIACTPITFALELDDHD